MTCLDTRNRAASGPADTPITRDTLLHERVDTQDPRHGGKRVVPGRQLDQGVRSALEEVHNHPGGAELRRRDRACQQRTWRVFGQQLRRHLVRLAVEYDAQQTVRRVVRRDQPRGDPVSVYRKHVIAGRCTVGCQRHGMPRTSSGPLHQLPLAADST